MLIIYDRASGDVVENTGTNSLFPEGPPEPWVNVDAQHLSREDYELLRLHDHADADLVQQILRNRYHVDPATGTVVIDGPFPVETLTADTEQAAAGDVVLVTYTNTHDDAPASVTFDANGATATVALTDGTAELEVTMPATGDVTVSIDRENVPPLTIRGV